MNQAVLNTVREYQNNPEMIKSLDSILSLLNQQKQNTAMGPKHIAVKFKIIDKPHLYNLNDEQNQAIEEIDFTLSILEDLKLIEGIQSGQIYKSYYIIQKGREFLKTTNFSTTLTKVTYESIEQQNQKDLNNKTITNQISDQSEKSNQRTYQRIFWVLTILINIFWTIYNVTYKCS